jgi:hypothetical protein
VELEEVSARRFAVAGAVLVAGLLLGFVLAGIFRWSPFYWQWLAYHNGLVACVIIYLLMSDATGIADVTIQSEETHPRDTATRRDRFRDDSPVRVENRQTLSHSKT